MCPTVTSQDKQDSHTEQQTYFLPSLHFIFQYQEVLLFVVHTYILANGMHDKIYCLWSCYRQHQQHVRRRTVCVTVTPQDHQDSHSEQETYILPPFHFNIPESGSVFNSSVHLPASGSVLACCCLSPQVMLIQMYTRMDYICRSYRYYYQIMFHNWQTSAAILK